MGCSFKATFQSSTNICIHVTHNLFNLDARSVIIINCHNAHQLSNIPLHCHSAYSKIRYLMSVCLHLLFTSHFLDLVEKELPLILAKEPRGLVKEKTRKTSQDHSQSFGTFGEFLYRAVHEKMGELLQSSVRSYTFVYLRILIV
ncbi:hypothetical protein TNCV_346241 [Trichonephila clavipes]|nr:hypothetical protein TNCV_346241 [Trichonephila clavipes]